MKVMTYKHELINALAIAGKTLGKSTPNSLLECFKLSVKENVMTIESTTLEEGTIANLPVSGEDGSICVEGRLFSEIIKKLPDDGGMVLIESKPTNAITIDVGAVHFDIKGINAADFPVIPVSKEGGINIEGSKFKSLISRSSYALATIDNVPTLLGINLKIEDTVIKTISLDGYRFAMGIETQETAQEEKMDIVVSGKILSSMVKNIKDEMIYISFDDHNFYLQTESFKHYCRLIEGKFIDVDAIMPTDDPTVQIQNLDRNTLLQSIERSCIMNNGGKDRLNFEITDTTMVIRTENDMGNSNEVIEISNGKKLKEPFKISFNGRYMIDLLKYYPEEHINMNMTTSVGPMLVTSETKQDVSLVLPIRVNA